MSEVAKLPRLASRRRASPGRVWLVGAGPGDPELLTVRAHRLVRDAAVLAHDELVSPAILALAPREAERIAVGRRKGRPNQVVSGIHPAVLARARAGFDVVRLKGGDPFVFGRGGEEAEALAAAGVPFEVVPGISAALGAAASSGIPLTHRRAAPGVTFVTAQRGAGDEQAEDATFGDRIPREGTVVVYMGLGRLEGIVRALVASGRAPKTPAAIVAHATLPTERVVVADLATIVVAAASARLEAPALLVVGEVVARRVLGLRANHPERRRSPTGSGRVGSQRVLHLARVAGEAG